MSKSAAQLLYGPVLVYFFIILVYNIFVYVLPIELLELCRFLQIIDLL